jgi:hypothetical protein
MSFAAKRDSKDTAKLRREYEDFARQSRETSDKGSAAALRDKKARAFERVKEQIVGERKENLSAVHKVLIQQGRLKSPQEMAAQRAMIAQRMAEAASKR